MLRAPTGWLLTSKGVEMMARMPSACACGVKEGQRVSLSRDSRETTGLGRRVDAGALPGFVLVRIHVGDRVIGGGHGQESPAAAQRHADTVGAAHGGAGQRQAMRNAPSIRSSSEWMEVNLFVAFVMPWEVRGGLPRPVPPPVPLLGTELAV